MILFRKMAGKTHVVRIISLFISCSFILTSITPGYAQGVFAPSAPAASGLLNITPAFTPVLVRAIEIDPKDPLHFNFIIDNGDTKLAGDTLTTETEKLIRYFLASLTVPEKDMWVNLSPYEKDRIVPDTFGNTEMGRDLLAQDYILKELTASLIHPEDEFGKKFWDKIYKAAYEKFGTTSIPVDTFNKVWIIPSKASVYEYGNRVFVIDSELNVMMEQDFVALQNGTKGESADGTKSKLASDVVREVILPAIKQEVNFGKNFANLRQIYNAMILATWYKKNLQETIIAKAYVDQNKIKGIELSREASHVKRISQVNDVSRFTSPEEIYQQYLNLFKQGAYNFIRVEHDRYTNKNIPRKYFSGGFAASSSSLSLSDNIFQKVQNPRTIPHRGTASNYSINFNAQTSMGTSSSAITIPQVSAAEGAWVLIKKVSEVLENNGKIFREFTISSKDKAMTFIVGDQTSAVRLKNILPSAERVTMHFSGMNVLSFEKVDDQWVLKSVQGPIVGDLTKPSADVPAELAQGSENVVEAEPIEQNIVPLSPVQLPAAKIKKVSNDASAADYIRAISAALEKENLKVLKNFYIDGRIFQVGTAVNVEQLGLALYSAKEVRMVFGDGTGIFFQKDGVNKRWKITRIIGSGFDFVEEGALLGELAGPVKVKDIPATANEQQIKERLVTDNAALSLTAGDIKKVEYYEPGKKNLFEKKLARMPQNIKDPVVLKIAVKDGYVILLRAKKSGAFELAEQVTPLPSALDRAENFINSLGLSSFDAGYLTALLKQYLEKSYIPLSIGGNFIPTAQMSWDETKKELAVLDYAAEIKGNPRYAQGFEKIVHRESLMNAGLATSMGLKTPKSTTIFYEDMVPGIDENGQPKLYKEKILLLEQKYLREILRAGKLGGIQMEELVNFQSRDYVNQFLDSVFLFDRVDHRPGTPKRTYRQMLKEKGIEILPQYEQALLPVFVLGTESLTTEFTAPGGHGVFGRRMADEILKIQLPAGKILMWSITNADGPNNAASEDVLNYMALENIGFAILSSTRMQIDAKGGIFGVQKLTNPVTGKKQNRTNMMELAQAKDVHQEEPFEAQGLDGNSKGPQLFNTNIPVANVTLLQPFLRELEGIVGHEKYIEITSPTLIPNPKEKGDAKIKVLQIEGALCHVIENLDAFIRTTDDQRVKDLVAKYKFKNGRILHIINFDPENRDIAFTPTKYSWDWVLYAYTDHYVRDYKTGMSINTRPGHIPGFDMDNYYADLQHSMDAFGGASVVDLDHLTVKGKATFPNTVLKGNVTIENKTDGILDLNKVASDAANAQLFADGFLAKNKNGRLVLDNVTVNYDENGLKVVKASSSLSGLVEDTDPTTMIKGWTSPHGKSLEEILNAIIKEYDIRGYDGGDDVNYPAQMDDKLLRWIGRELGSVPFYSSVHDRTVSLKPGDTFVIAGDNGPTTQKVNNALIEGLRDTGVNVIDLGTVPSGLLYFIIKVLNAKGGLYVTRSHVEVGTNGAKPVIDGITLFGEMLQAMKAPILANQYKKAQTRGTLTKSGAAIAQAEKAYHDFLVEEFKGLKAILDKMPMKITLNLNGGSTAADPNVKKNFKEILGDHLVNVLRDESDPWGEKGGLADSSRDDAKALAHPKANIIEYSKQHPDEVIFNFDLDADRVSIVFNGKLYLGDDMFLPVVEYQLTMAQDKEYYKEMFIDSRMKATLTDAVKYFGGIVKKHPKGHSKVKASMDVALEAMAKKKNLSVEEFLKAHPKFRMLQPEFSLHMFSSNKYGASIDDAVRFSLIWLEIFSAIKEKYNQPNWTLPEYVQYLEDQGIVKPVSQVKEQRTAIKDSAKVAVMKKMTQKVQDYFGRHQELKYEFYPRWQDFNGSSADYVFVDVDGVYDFTTPLGHVFWGWSNTSGKIAYGVQSDMVEKTRKLTEIIISLLAQSREEVAAEMGVELESLNPTELMATQKLFNITSEDLPTFEIELKDQYPGDKLFEALASSSAIGNLRSSSAVSQKLDSDMLNKGFIVDDEGYYSPTTSPSSSSTVTVDFPKDALLPIQPIIDEFVKGDQSRRKASVLLDSATYKISNLIDAQELKTLKLQVGSTLFLDTPELRLIITRFSDRVTVASTSYSTGINVQLQVPLNAKIQSAVEAYLRQQAKALTATNGPSSKIRYLGKGQSLESVYDLYERETTHTVYKDSYKTMVSRFSEPGYHVTDEKDVILKKMPQPPASSSSAAVPFQGGLDIGLLAKNMDSKIRVRFAHLFEDMIVLTSKFYAMPVPSIILGEGQRVKFDLMNGSSVNIVRRGDVILVSAEKPVPDSTFGSSMQNDPEIQKIAVEIISGSSASSSGITAQEMFAKVGKIAQESNKDERNTLTLIEEGRKVRWTLETFVNNGARYLEGVVDDGGLTAVEVTIYEGDAPKVLSLDLKAGGSQFVEKTGKPSADTAGASSNVITRQQLISQMARIIQNENSGVVAMAIKSRNGQYESVNVAEPQAPWRDFTFRDPVSQNYSFVKITLANGEAYFLNFKNERGNAVIDISKVRKTSVQAQTTAARIAEALIKRSDLRWGSRSNESYLKLLSEENERNWTAVNQISADFSKERAAQKIKDLAAREKSIFIDIENHSILQKEMIEKWLSGSGKPLAYQIRFQDGSYIYLVSKDFAYRDAAPKTINYLPGLQDPKERSSTKMPVASGAETPVAENPVAEKPQAPTVTYIDGVLREKPSSSTSKSVPAMIKDLTPEQFKQQLADFMEQIGIQDTIRIINVFDGNNFFDIRVQHDYQNIEKALSALQDNASNAAEQSIEFLVNMTRVVIDLEGGKVVGVRDGMPGITFGVNQDDIDRARKNLPPTHFLSTAGGSTDNIGKRNIKDLKPIEISNHLRVFLEKLRLETGLRSLDFRIGYYSVAQQLFSSASKIENPEYVTFTLTSELTNGNTLIFPVKGGKVENIRVIGPTFFLEGVRSALSRLPADNFLSTAAAGSSSSLRADFTKADFEQIKEFIEKNNLLKDSRSRILLGLEGKIGETPLTVGYFLSFYGGSFTEKKNSINGVVSIKAEYYDEKNNHHVQELYSSVGQGFDELNTSSSAVKAEFSTDLDLLKFVSMFRLPREERYERVTKVIAGKKTYFPSDFKKLDGVILGTDPVRVRLSAHRQFVDIKRVSSTEVVFLAGRLASDSGEDSVRDTALEKEAGQVLERMGGRVIGDAAFDDSVGAAKDLKDGASSAIAVKWNLYRVNSKSLERRLKAVEALRKYSDPKAVEAVKAFDDLMARIPDSTSKERPYKKEMKAAELLSEARDIRKAGFDFEVKHQAEQGEYKIVKASFYHGQRIMQSIMEGNGGYDSYYTLYGKDGKVIGTVDIVSYNEGDEIKTADVNDWIVNIPETVQIIKVSSTLGGISMDSKTLDMNVKRDGTSSPITVSDQAFYVMNIQGFTFTIMSITPVPNIMLLSGLTGTETNDSLSQKISEGIGDALIADKREISLTL